MKKIISDSLWAHLLMFLFLLDMLTPVATFAPFLFVSIGSLYVLLVFNSAINIANFEMSDLGQFVEKANSGKYKHIEVRYFK